MMIEPSKINSSVVAALQQSQNANETQEQNSIFEDDKSVQSVVEEKIDDFKKANELLDLVNLGIENVFDNEEVDDCDAPPPTLTPSYEDEPPIASPQDAPPPSTPPCEDEPPIVSPQDAPPPSTPPEDGTPSPINPSVVDEGANSNSEAPDNNDRATERHK